MISYLIFLLLNLKLPIVGAIDKSIYLKNQIQHMQLSIKNESNLLNTVFTNGPTKPWHDHNVSLASNSAVVLNCPHVHGASIFWMHSLWAPDFLVANSNKSNLVGSPNRSRQAQPVSLRFPSRLCRPVELSQPPNAWLMIKIESPSLQAGYYWCQSRTPETGQPNINAVFHLNLNKRNSFGSQSLSIPAYKAESLLVDNKAVTALTGSRVALPCQSALNTAAGRFQWVRNGAFIFGGPLLVLYSVKSTDSGLYACWLVDSGNRPLKVFARWDLLVLQLADSDAAASLVGKLDYYCSNDGSKLAGSGSGRCLVTWSDVSPAADALLDTPILKKSWPATELAQRLRRSLTDDLTGSSIQHQSSLNLRILFATGRILRVAWDPPDSSADCLKIRLHLQQSSGKSVSTVYSISCSSSFAELSIRPGFSYRLFAEIVSSSNNRALSKSTTSLYFTASRIGDLSAKPRETRSAQTEALADQLRIKDLLPIGKRDSILLSWTRPSRVLPDKYVINYGLHYPKERSAGEISGDRDSFQIRNLEPDTRYFICVSAVKREYHFETPIEARTLGSKDDSGYPLQPPQVPMAVKVSQVGSRNASVTWTDPQLGLPGGLQLSRRVYEVEWSFDTGEQPQALPPPPSSSSPSTWRVNTSELSVGLAGLRPSTAYTVRVRCLAIASDVTAVPSEFSMRASFVTQPEAPGSPPRDLKISRSSLPMSVMLSWLPPLQPNGKITKYTVLYRPVDSSGGPPASEQATPTAETQVVIAGLKPSRHYYFRVRAANSQGSGPESEPIEFMMPDSSGQGGGVVYNTDSVLQRDSADGSDSDGLSSRRWWLLIAGVFGLALLLLAVSTAFVCVCQQRRPGRSASDRAAAAAANKESASLIPEQQPLQPPPPPHSHQSLQPPPGPGLLASASPMSMPPTSAALLAGHQIQHHQLHQLQLQQQHTPDLCRHADFELRAMAEFGGGGRGHPMMPMQLPPPPPMLLESGPASNPHPQSAPGGGHFRNLSNSGSGSYQLPGQQHRIGSVVSPPRVDAPDFSSPGKLSSPHSSLSSSIGSASKQRHAVASSAAAAAAGSAGGGPLMSTSAHSRPYPAPDILNPAPGHRQLDQRPPHQHVQQPHQLRNSHATIGSLTMESQNSQNFTLSTEDMDMAKTLDGLIQDLKGLTTREFEC